MLFPLTLPVCTDISAHIPSQILHLNWKLLTLDHIKVSFNFDVDATFKFSDIFWLSAYAHITNSRRSQKIGCYQSTPDLLNLLFAQHKRFEKTSPLTKKEENQFIRTIKPSSVKKFKTLQKNKPY